MSTALVMAGREALMLAVVGALGAWPATFLPRRFDGVARVGMSPVLGLCAGTCVFTTLVWFVPASDTYWLVPLLCAGSLAGALFRTGGRAQRPRGKHAAHAEDDTESNARTGRAGRSLVGLLQILVVCVAVAGPITYAFAGRQSVGPVGYLVGDAQGYVAETDGMQHQSIQQAVHATETTRSWSNLELAYWSNYASGVQEMDATPLSANLNELVGLGASDTQSSYLVAFLLAGALGVYAALRYATRRSSWVGVLAGALFGGAFFLQLFFDGSEGAITGLAVIVPLAVLLVEAVRAPRPATLVLLALLTSGLVALYPLFVPALVIGAAITCAVLLAWRLWTGRIALRTVGQATLCVVAVGGLAALFNLVATTRAVKYWYHVLHGELLHAPLPRYTFLKSGVIPSWLYQARQFYDLSQPGGTLLARVGLTVVVPVLLTIVLLTGLRRHLLAWLLLATLAGACALGAYERVHNACGYCADRNLLPIGPIVAFLVCLGIAALVASASWWPRGVGVLAVCVAIAAIGPTAYSSVMRYRDGSYFLDPAVRSALAHLPSKGTVALEGFNENADSIVEQGLVYMYAEEHAWNRVTMPADRNESSSLEYLASGRADLAYPLGGAQFTPSYVYVLTRMPSVADRRRLIARVGGVALERRAQPVDVLVDFGLIVANTQDDEGGYAYVDPYVNESMQFIVTGTSRRRIFVELVFKLPSAARIRATGSAIVSSVQAHRELEVCLLAAREGGARELQVTVSPDADIQLIEATSAASCPATSG